MIVLLNKMCKYLKLLFVTELPIFSAIIQKPIKKPHMLFVKGTRVMLTFGGAYTNKSSLEHCIEYKVNTSISMYAHAHIQHDTVPAVGVLR